MTTERLADLFRDYNPLDVHVKTNMAGRSRGESCNLQGGQKSFVSLFVCLKAVVLGWPGISIGDLCRVRAGQVRDGGQRADGHHEPDRLRDRGQGDPGADSKERADSMLGDPSVLKNAWLCSTLVVTADPLRQATER